VEDALIKSGQFRLPGRQLVRGFGKPIVVVLDVTETPLSVLTSTLLLLWQEKQTLKCQLVIEQATGRVVTFFGKGRRHDFKLFQASGVHFHPETVESLQDKGYQGIQKLHVNSRLP